MRVSRGPSSLCGRGAGVAAEPVHIGSAVSDRTVQRSTPTVSRQVGALPPQEGQPFVPVARVQRGLSYPPCTMVVEKGVVTWTLRKTMLK
jgi:hypothetical protein